MKCSASTVVSIQFSIKEASFYEKSQSLDHLLLPLQSNYNPEYLTCNYVQILEIDESMEGLLEISPAQQCHLEELTHRQANSNFRLNSEMGVLQPLILPSTAHKS